MAEVEQYIEDMKMIVEAAKGFQKSIDKACGGSFEWGMDQVLNSYLGMFDRFCPFKIGDRVQLKEDIKVDKDSGWFHCMHFLKKGEKATVVERGWSTKGTNLFTFSVMFDNETWIDHKGTKHPVDKKHTFYLSEKWLESIIENPKSTQGLSETCGKCKKFNIFNSSNYYGRCSDENSDNPVVCVDDWCEHYVQN